MFRHNVKVAPSKAAERKYCILPSAVVIYNSLHAMMKSASFSKSSSSQMVARHMSKSWRLYPKKAFPCILSLSIRISLMVIPSLMTDRQPSNAIRLSRHQAAPFAPTHGAARWWQALQRWRGEAAKMAGMLFLSLLLLHTTTRLEVGMHIFFWALSCGDRC